MLRNNQRQRVSRMPTPSITVAALASLLGRTLRATRIVHPSPPEENDDGPNNDEVRRASFDSDPFPRSTSLFGLPPLSISEPNDDGPNNDEVRRVSFDSDPFPRSMSFFGPSSSSSLRNLRDSRREKRRKANALVEEFSRW